jgi:hypothetical protein
VAFDLQPSSPSRSQRPLDCVTPEKHTDFPSNALPKDEIRMSFAKHLFAWVITFLITGCVSGDQLSSPRTFSSAAQDFSISGSNAFANLNDSFVDRNIAKVAGGDKPLTDDTFVGVLDGSASVKQTTTALKALGAYAESLGALANANYGTEVDKAATGLHGALSGVGKELDGPRSTYLKNLDDIYTAEFEAYKKEQPSLSFASRVSRLQRLRMVSLHPNQSPHSALRANLSKNPRTFAATSRSVILSSVSTPTTFSPRFFFSNRLRNSPFASPGPKINTLLNFPKASITAS